MKHRGPHALSSASSLGSGDGTTSDGDRSDSCTTVGPTVVDSVAKTAVAIEVMVKTRMITNSWLFMGELQRFRGFIFIASSMRVVAIARGWIIYPKGAHNVGKWV